MKSNRVDIVRRSINIFCEFASSSLTLPLSLVQSDVYVLRFTIVNSLQEMPPRRAVRSHATSAIHFPLRKEARARKICNWRSVYFIYDF